MVEEPEDELDVNDMIDSEEETAGMPDFHSGFVAVIGRPNVGKSTLMNALVGQKIAAVSPKPQTTRRQQLGILTTDDSQIIFVDTPGLHIPVHKLGEYMNETAAETLEDADVVLWMVDASEEPAEEDRLIAERLWHVTRLPPVLLVLNKIDRINREVLADRQARFLSLFSGAVPVAISASTGAGYDELLTAIRTRLPEAPPYFSPEEITDYYERDIAAELIREAALLHLREEVPHGIAVRIDEFTERGENGAYIAATIFVERESQKGIVIGRQAEMLKQIGTTAREQIQAMNGRKVFLELRVKVHKNWRDNPDALRIMGYASKKKK